MINSEVQKQIEDSLNKVPSRVFYNKEGVVFIPLPSQSICFSSIEEIDDYYKCFEKIKKQRIPRKLKKNLKTKDILNTKYKNKVFDGLLRKNL